MTTATPSAQGADDDPWSTRVLHEDEHLRIELSTRCRPAAAIAVTFDPIVVTAEQAPYAGAFLHKCGVDTLAVRKKSDHFYQPLSRERFEAVARPVLDGYAQRYAYGSSLGGYAVLYFCREGFDRVISSSPRVSPHPRHGVDFWRQRVAFEHEAFDPAQPASSPAEIFYDPHDALDRALVEQEIGPAWPRARLRPVPYSGHPTNLFLADVGFIAPFLRAIIAGVAEPVLDRRSLKARSAVYHQVLAMGCLQHHKPAWALALCDRALGLNPQALLTHRTRGQALLALDRLDEAEQCLQVFLRHYPLDGEAIAAQKALLQRRSTSASLPGRLRVWLRRVRHAAGRRP